MTPADKAHDLCLAIWIQREKQVFHDVLLIIEDPIMVSALLMLFYCCDSNH